MTLQEQNKALFRRALNDFMNERKLDTANQNYAPTYVQHNAEVRQLAERQGLGPVEGMVSFFKLFFAAFPDYHAEPEYVGAEGDRVFAIVNWEGTFQKEFMGIPPTGERIRIRSAELMRIENGQFAEHWDVVDDKLLQVALGTLRRIEHAAPPADAGLPDAVAIQNVIARYYYYVDTKNVSDWLALWMPDGHLQNGGHIARGQSELQTFAAAHIDDPKKHTRHMASNIAVSIRGDQAELVNYMLVIDSIEQTAQHATAICRSSLCRHQGHWKLQSHVFETDPSFDFSRVGP